VTYEGGGMALAVMGNVAVLSNNIISGNTAGAGGGICINIVPETIITNNTIIYNSANVYDPDHGQQGKGGGLKICLRNDSDSADIHNNIILNNSAVIMGNDIYITNDENDNHVPSPVNLYNNDFNQTQTSGTYIQIPFSIDSSNLDNEDPLFVDPTNDDYHLSYNSPCKDAGAAENAPDIDFDGDSRPQGLVYDIGADEYVSIFAITDILALFNDGVDAGTIEGSGNKQWEKDINLWWFEKMLERAALYHGIGMEKALCLALGRCFGYCDGLPKIKDLLKGEATPQLASMIDDVMINMDCF
jgi:hypothetical protein